MHTWRNCLPRKSALYLALLSTSNSVDESIGLIVANNFRERRQLFLVVFLPPHRSLGNVLHKFYEAWGWREKASGQSVLHWKNTPYRCGKH